MENDYKDPIKSLQDRMVTITSRLRAVAEQYDGLEHISQTPGAMGFFDYLHHNPDATEQDVTSRFSRVFRLFDDDLPFAKEVADFMYSGSPLSRASRSSSANDSPPMTPILSPSKIQEQERNSTINTPSPPNGERRRVRKQPTAGERGQLYMDYLALHQDATPEDVKTAGFEEEMNQLFGKSLPVAKHVSRERRAVENEPHSNGDVLPYEVRRPRLKKIRGFRSRSDNLPLGEQIQRYRDLRTYMRTHRDATVPDLVKAGYNADLYLFFKGVINDARDKFGIPRKSVDNGAEKTKQTDGRRIGLGERVRRYRGLKKYILEHRDSSGSQLKKDGHANDLALFFGGKINKARKRFNLPLRYGRETSSPTEDTLSSDVPSQGDRQVGYSKNDQQDPVSPLEDLSQAFINIQEAQRRVIEYFETNLTATKAALESAGLVDDIDIGYGGDVREAKKAAATIIIQSYLSLCPDVTYANLVADGHAHALNLAFDGKIRDAKKSLAPQRGIDPEKVYSADDVIDLILQNDNIGSSPELHDAVYSMTILEFNRLWEQLLDEREQLLDYAVNHPKEKRIPREYALAGHFIFYGFLPLVREVASYERTELPALRNLQRQTDNRTPAPILESPLR